MMKTLVFFVNQNNMNKISRESWVLYYFKTNWQGFFFKKKEEEPLCESSDESHANKG